MLLLNGTAAIFIQKQIAQLLLPIMKDGNSKYPPPV